jgi:hypothetical protein
MVSQNYIYFNQNDLDRPIYRIISTRRFIQILTTNEFTLVSPKKWDDPFENTLASTSIQVGHEAKGVLKRNGVYGQCWTWHKETDAMWRIYSPSKDGVRLMTTPRRLLTSLQNAIGASAKCFIGQIQYKRKSALQAYFYEINVSDISGVGVAESLLYKSVQFRHEAEVRLIYCAEEKVSHSNDVFGYQVSPSNLFDEVLFDPRMDRVRRKFCTETMNCLGYSFKIKKSTMYDAPRNLRFKFPS